MDFKVLNEDNFAMYTMKMYTNPQCQNMDEFHEDMNRIKYIKRLLGKYEKNGHIPARLVLNHLQVINNVFGSEPCCRILFYKIEDSFHSCLKSFLEYLNFLPMYIPEVELSKIPSDHKITLLLGQLK